MFVPASEFKQKHGLRKILRFRPSEMDIAGEGIKCVMNLSGDIFRLNDTIFVEGIHVRVVGFAAYDNECFGAICVGRDKTLAKWFRLDEAINITEQSRHGGSPYDVLKRRGFQCVDAMTFNKGNFTVCVDIKAGTFEAFCDYKSGDMMGYLTYDKPLKLLEQFVTKAERIGIVSMCFEDIPGKYFTSRFFTQE